jgi:LacI family transcriptional regulator
VFTDPYFPVVTQGISKMSNRLDLTLALFLFQSLEEERVTIQSILVTGLLDGLIITSDYRDDSFLPQLFEYEMPFVLIGRPDNSDGINFIDTDNVDGARIATEHLIGLAYERIGTIASDQNTSGDDRFRGYREAMVANGRPILDELVAYGDYSLESGYERMKQLIPHKPDAVFVASDTMALGALSALREAGLRVPHDVAIVAYDDLPPAFQADPPLTTIRQPIEQTGILAVETLKQIITDSNQPPRQMILPVELVVRQSCGAV